MLRLRPSTSSLLHLGSLFFLPLYCEVHGSIAFKRMIKRFYYFYKFIYLFSSASSYPVKEIFSFSFPGILIEENVCVSHLANKGTKAVVHRFVWITYCLIVANVFPQINNKFQGGWKLILWSINTVKRRQQKTSWLFSFILHQYWKHLKLRMMFSLGKVSSNTGDHE